MKKYIISLIILSVGLGVGFAIGAAFILSDHPSIIVETKWKTITTAPPVTYSPETPWHTDPAVICETTTTTVVPSTTSTVHVPVTQVPSTKTTVTQPPPSTLPPSSTTLTSETTTTNPVTTDSKN